MFSTQGGSAAQESEGRRIEAQQRVPAAAQSPLARLADPGWVAAVLWARKGPILLTALLGALLAALASLALPPRYVSTAQLFIDPRDLRVLQNEVSPNTTGGDPTAITAYLESQARIIASDSIKLRVIESEGLDKDPDYGGTRPGPFSWLGSPPAARDARLLALAALDRAVSIRRGERTFVIDIGVTAPEPEKAARIANALANAYLEDQTKVRAEAAQRATAALTGRLEELRNRLRIAEDKAEAYKERNNIVGVGGGRSLGEEQLTLASGQLSVARTRTAEARAKYEQILSTRASGIEAGAVPEAVASNTMTALRSQLGAALAREADLTASLGTRHPALAAAQSQVRDARRQIGEELGRIARAAKVEYDRAVDAERELSRRVDQLTTTQYATGRASVELRELEREVESNRAIYDAFLRRARETGELAGIDTTNARVISAAVPPLQRSGVSRRALALLGGLVGGALGAMLALGLALLAPTRTPPKQEEPAARGDGPPATPAPSATISAPPTSPPAPAAPAAASLPALAEAAAPAPAPPARPGSGWRRFVGIPGGAPAKRPAALEASEATLLATLPAVRHRRWRRPADEARSVFQGKAHLVDVLDKPGGRFARAVRTVRQALSAAEGRPRRILVTALRPRAGSSTLALNLALDAAIAGLPAMLVDAGRPEGGLSASFAPDADAGLQEILGGAGLIRVALQDEGTGLFFLPRHGRVDLVTSAQIGTGFFEAARRFGPIVVDGAALGTEALTLRFAEAVDDILLVIREGAVSAQEIEAANRVLGPQAAKIRGFVVNGA